MGKYFSKKQGSIVFQLRCFTENPIFYTHCLFGAIDYRNQIVA